MENLKKNIDYLINKYVSIFEKKQGLYFGGWAGDNIGEIAYMGDFDFSFTDIRHDLDTEQPPEKILDWYSYAIEEDSTMNYKSWLKLNPS